LPELDEPRSANPGAFSPVLIGALGMFSSLNIFTAFGWLPFRARSRRASSPSVKGCSGCMDSIAAELAAFDRDEGVAAAAVAAADELAGAGDAEFLATVWGSCCGADPARTSRPSPSDRTPAARTTSAFLTGAGLHSVAFAWLPSPRNFTGRPPRCLSSGIPTRPPADYF
jgi:hypothetical protein